MFASLSILALTLLPAMVASAAIPETSVSTSDAVLAKRDQQALYLVNCARENPNNSQDQYPASYGVWYGSLDASKRYANPDAISNEYRNWAKAGGDYLHWEGQTQNIWFPDSSTNVAVYINNGADGVGFQQYAGNAVRSSDNYNFSCYKDNSRGLFEEYSPNVPDHSVHNLRCWSVYYCV